MRRAILSISISLAVLSASAANAQNDKPHNLILFVPDGLRALIVKPETAPAMADVRDKGVNFANSHSMFPTFTMANSSAMATGHYLGDSGTFSNTIFTGYTVAPAGDTVTPFIENDLVLGDVDEHFAGNYLNEEVLLQLARAKGYSTAAIGKVGPTLLFDHTDRADRPGGLGRHANSHPGFFRHPQLPQRPHGRFPRPRPGGLRRGDVGGRLIVSRAAAGAADVGVVRLGVSPSAGSGAPSRRPAGCRER